MDTAAANRPLLLRTVIAYALLSLPIALSLPPVVVHWVTDRPGGGFSAPLAIVAAVAVLRTLDTLAPLLLGRLGDRLGGYRAAGWAGGAGLLLCALAPLMLLEPSPHGPLLLLLTLTACLGAAAMRVSQLAWGAELCGHYHQRTRLYSAAQFATLLGVGCGVAAPFVAAPLGASLQQGLNALFWATLAAALVALIGATLGLPERRGTPATGSLRHTLRRLRSNLAWRRLLTAHGLNTAANTLFALLIVHLTYLVSTGDAWVVPTLATYIGAALIGLPLAVGFARRYGKHATWSVALIFTAATLVWVPLLSAGDRAALLILAGLIGLSAGLDRALPAAMQADVVDSETVRNDSACAGVHFGVWLLASQLAVTVAAALVVGIVWLSGGSTALLPGGGTEIAPSIGLLAGLVPAFLKLIVVALVWDFPIHDTRQRELRGQICARRQAVDTTEESRTCAASRRPPDPQGDRREE